MVKVHNQLVNLKLQRGREDEADALGHCKRIPEQFWGSGKLNMLITGDSAPTDGQAFTGIYGGSMGPWTLSTFSLFMPQQSQLKRSSLPLAFTTLRSRLWSLQRALCLPCFYNKTELIRLRRLSLKLKRGQKGLEFTGIALNLRRKPLKRRDARVCFRCDRIWAVVSHKVSPQFVLFFIFSVTQWLSGPQDSKIRVNEAVSALLSVRFQNLEMENWEKKSFFIGEQKSSIFEEFSSFSEDAE